MTKQEFLQCLRQGLAGIPQSEIEDRVEFYSEMIDDRIDDGLSEDEAVSEVGKTDDIIAQIISEIPLAKLIKEKNKGKRQMKTWEILLIAAGFPIWLPILLSVVAVILSLYVSIWAVIISLWAVSVSLAACAIGLISYGVMSIIMHNALNGLFVIGAAFICGGLSIFMFIGTNYLSKCTVLITKKPMNKLKAYLFKRR